MTADFAAATGTFERCFLLTRWERDLAYRVVRRIERESGSTCRTVNLELTLLEYANGPPGDVHPDTLSPSAPRSHAFRVYPHQDQAEIIDLALGQAKDAIEDDDDAAALVHILREVYRRLAGKKP